MDDASETMVEAVARAIHPEAWARRDADALRRDEWEKELSGPWSGTTFEEWVGRFTGQSLDYARAAIATLRPMIVAEETAALKAELAAVRAAADELQSREAAYRQSHDLDGGGASATGRCWDLMRRAGDKLRAILRPGGNG